MIISTVRYPTTAGTCLMLAILFLGLNLAPVSAQNRPGDRQLIQMKIYHLDSRAQELKVDRFLRDFYLPALHRGGVEPVGVFKPMGQDTTSDRRIYLLVPYESFSGMMRMHRTLLENRSSQSSASYFDRTPGDPPYSHIETILLEAFSHSPRVQAPKLIAPGKDRVYELRSYGSPTEALNRNKVEMFNEGGEVAIFSRLGFNAVFYGNVVSGSEMPNLMYMTSFSDMRSRDAHWESFRNDPAWDKLSSMEKYQNNVSRIDIQFLKSTNYSDI